MLPPNLLLSIQCQHLLPDQKKKKKKMSFLRHYLAICYVNLQLCEVLFLSEKSPNSHSRVLLILMTERYTLGLKEGVIDLFSPLFPWLAAI